MTLITFGIILLFISFLVRNQETGLTKFNRIARIAGAGLIIAGFLLSSVIEIDAGKIGVKKMFGKVQSDILKSGLHLINPVSYTHLRAHETVLDLVCRLLLENKKQQQ